MHRNRVYISKMTTLSKLSCNSQSENSVCVCVTEVREGQRGRGKEGDKEKVEREGETC